MVGRSSSPTERPMNRPLATLVALLLFACTAGQAGAQIRIETLPPKDVDPGEQIVYADWWVSAALVGDDKPTTLGTRFDTKEEAEEYAKRVLEANHRTSPPGAWTRIQYV